MKSLSHKAIIDSIHTGRNDPLYKHAKIAARKKVLSNYVSRTVKAKMLDVLLNDAYDRAKQEAAEDAAGESI